MAFAHSPKIVTDGMVFYYDTGNSKSYAGEPTVNLHPDPENVSNWTGNLFGNWINSTVTPNVSVAPDGTLTADRIGDGYGRFNSSITAIPGQTYVYTVYLKNVDLTNNFGIAVGWGLNGSLVSYNSNATTVQISQISDTEWTRVTATEVAPSSGINQVQFGVTPFTGHGNPSGQTVDVWGGMIEQKSHATPYTAGTRSATEALKDFTKNATLDLANVSFDSNAQMTFDGTNDELQVDVNSWIRDVDAVTIEGVVEIPAGASTAGGPWSIMTDQTDVTQRDGFWWHLRLGGGFTYFRVEDTVNGEQGITFSNPSSFSAGNTYHIVTVVGNNGVKVYNNGVLVESYNPPFNWKDISATNVATLFIGRTYPNYYLNSINHLVKAYNRALSAEEVQQNFNTIKGRFGI